jgi:excisionase family DNA binding protein
MSAPTSTLEASSITEVDRRRAEEFITTDEQSALSILLQQVLQATARGADIEVFSADAELSPNQASDLLKMSRPHLLSFMDRGELPFHRVGTHRRIKMSDLREFMQAREAGAEILANALHGGATAVDTSPEFSADELSELDCL